MKLLAIHLPSAALTSVGGRRAIGGDAANRYVDLARPLDSQLNWVVAIRAGTVVVIVPPPSEQPVGPKIQPGGYCFPRNQCVELWDSTKVDDYQKPEQAWTSEPLKRSEPAPVPEVDQPAPAKAAK